MIIIAQLVCAVGSGFEEGRNLIVVVFGGVVFAQLGVDITIRLVDKVTEVEGFQEAFQFRVLVKVVEGFLRLSGGKII